MTLYNTPRRAFTSHSPLSPPSAISPPVALSDFPSLSMPPGILLPCLTLSSLLLPAAAMQAGSIVQAGSTLVSAMMVRRALCPIPRTHPRPDVSRERRDGVHSRQDRGQRCPNRWSPSMGFRLVRSILPSLPRPSGNEIIPCQEHQHPSSNHYERAQQHLLCFRHASPKRILCCVWWQ